MSRKRSLILTAAMVAIYAAALAALLAVRAFAGGGYVTATERPYAEVCFPRRAWSARAQDRPCDIIERPAEDGSGRLWLGTRGADAAECHLPNPWEARGRFVVHCHRLPDHPRA